MSTFIHEVPLVKSSVRTNCQCTILKVPSLHPSPTHPPPATQRICTGFWPVNRISQVLFRRTPVKRTKIPQHHLVRYGFQKANFFASKLPTSILKAATSCIKPTVYDLLEMASRYWCLHCEPSHVTPQKKGIEQIYFRPTVPRCGYAVKILLNSETGNRCAR